MKLSRLEICLLFIAVLLLPSCGAPKLFVADRQMARGEYYEASKTYRQIYNNLKQRKNRGLKAEIAFKMAEAHRMLSQWGQASAAYHNAIRYGFADSAAWLNLARVQMAEGKYTLATKTYADFLERYPNSSTARKGIEQASWASNAFKQKSRYIVKSARIFNSMRSEFAPMLHGDLLYLTTTNEKVTGKEKSEITGMKMSDIWVARKNENGKWLRPEPLEGDINTDMDEGVCCFSPDGSLMYLTKSRRTASSNTAVEIHTSQRINARWEAPEKLRLNIDSLRSYGHPAISPSGEYLYFTSDMPGMGGKDIWRVNLAHLDSRPVNMGDEINTSGNEMYPYMLTDSIMFFASDGHPGFGGLDIFKAVLRPNGKWEISNMGQPVNSSADDFGITFEKSAPYPQGFFSSNRNDRRGYDNIYSFELPDIKVSINGWVLDHDSNPIKGCTIRIVGDDGSIQRTATDADGEFELPLSPGVKYIMMASAASYLNARKEFSTDSTLADASYEIEFTMASLTKPNILENIFYDFDKASLRPESKQALDGLVKLLQGNPNIVIEMASHTDRIGSDEYNNDLSQRRAKSAVDYLISAGIEPERLQFHGFGKSKPKTVTKHDAELYPLFNEGDILTEEFIQALPDETSRKAADQINRRTEFSILSTDYNIF